MATNSSSISATKHDNKLTDNTDSESISLAESPSKRATTTYTSTVEYFIANIEDEPKSIEEEEVKVKRFN